MYLGEFTYWNLNCAIEKCARAKISGLIFSRAIFFNDEVFSCVLLTV